MANKRKVKKEECNCKIDWNKLIELVSNLVTIIDSCLKWIKHS